MSRIKGMTLEEAIKNREDCLKYLEGIGRKASPECVEAVRWSVKALKALRPVSLEQLSEFKTCDLVDELRKRVGVETHIAEPYQDVTVSVNGPAVVLVVID